LTLDNSETGDHDASHASGAGTGANGPFELVERDIPDPGPRNVRVKVQACSVCHSDSVTKMGAFPGACRGTRLSGFSMRWAPMCPTGNLGSASGWDGTVATGGHCRSCRRGDFVTCRNGQIPGISYDGGYADYMIAPFEALAPVPDELASVSAKPRSRPRVYPAAKVEIGDRGLVMHPSRPPVAPKQIAVASRAAQPVQHPTPEAEPGPASEQSV
jgi:hypothetical protein